MRDQLFQQRTPAVATASAIILQSRYSFARSSSYSSEDSKLEAHFDFSISKELLIDPNDIMVGEMIGEGGHSVVHRGVYKNQLPVAVKIVQPSRTSAVTKEQKEKFEKEVLLLSKIKHDNIVKFIGASIEPHLMIVTELLDGGTLQRSLWNSRPNTFDLGVSLNYALDISRAMEVLHSNGIIHRDLKPGNILLTGDLSQVKIADFGTAREETTEYMTAEAGTYRWMAPEVFSREPLKVGEKLPYDHKADVYSFAIVLWELLTNETPFREAQSMLVPYIISQKKRPSLINVPDEVVSILESCWENDPNARPEFKEITILLENLLMRLCPFNSCAATASSVEAILDQIDDPETNLNQERGIHDMKPKEKNKKKKMLRMMLPFLKMFRACLYKS